MAARLTPDQKVGSSNLSALILQAFHQCIKWSGGCHATQASILGYRHMLPLGCHDEFCFLRNTGKKGVFSRCLKFPNQVIFQTWQKTGQRQASFEDLCWRDRFGFVAKHRQKRVFFEVSRIPKSSDFSKMAKKQAKHRPVLRNCAGETELEF